MEITKENITAKLALKLCKENKGMNWYSEEDGFIWKKYHLTVVGDAHLSCGTRVHIVKESMENLPTELDNALVFSLQDVGLEI